MLDTFKKFFNTEDNSKTEVKKLDDDTKTIKMELLKKKVLEHLNKIQPDKKEEKNELVYSMEPSNSMEYTNEHGESLKKFLHEPSVDKLNTLKQEGRWRHLNKIFANTNEHE